MEHAGKPADLRQRALFDRSAREARTRKRPAATNQHCIRITIPRGLTFEVFSPPSLPGWESMPPTVSNAFGEQWCFEGRSLILIVPSIVARLDRNVLINPGHQEFRHVETSPPEPVFWDRRLFGSGP